MSDPNSYDLSSGLGVRLYPGAIRKVDGWKPAAPPNSARRRSMRGSRCIGLGAVAMPQNVGSGTSPGLAGGHSMATSLQEKLATARMRTMHTRTATQADRVWPGQSSWRDDDGSAAHEPACADFTSPADARPAVLARLTAQAEQIGRLICERDNLARLLDNKLAEVAHFVVGFAVG